MTPTMASAKKATHNRTSTPTSMSIEKAVTGKWMTSAVRRVGLRRIGGDGTPRSKKEGPKHFHNAVTFPDKVRYILDPFLLHVVIRFPCKRIPRP